MPNLNFADLSSNNGPNAFNAPEYASAGHVLIGIKATDGTGYVNPYWAAQTHAAHQSHISVVHYHYAEPGAILPQAKHFLDTLEKSGEYHERYDAIALDIERGQNIADPSTFVREFDAYCRGRGHRNLIVYTELSYHEEHGLKPQNGRMWVAAYSQTVRGYWAQQYSDAANVHGINGKCDVSRLSLGAWAYHRTHRP